MDSVSTLTNLFDEANVELCQTEIRGRIYVGGPKKPDWLPRGLPNRS